MKVLGRIMSRSRRNAAGFTLIEVLVGAVILVGITSATAMALITSLNAQSNTHQRIAENNDAQFISAFLVRDAQAAGGSLPTSGTVDPTLGVWLDDGECGEASTSPVVRLKWIDRSVSTTPPTRVVNYFYRPGSNELVRNSCVNTVLESTIVLGRNIAPTPSSSCNPSSDCPGLPDTVSITLTETNDPQTAPTPYTYTLTASLRPEAQAQPTSGTAQTVPLLALGSGVCVNETSGIRLSGTAGLHITVGGAIVNGPNASGCTAISINGNVTYSADSTTILAGGTCAAVGSSSCPSPIGTMSSPIRDPFAGLATPPGAGSCGGGGNPSAGPNYVAGVYNQTVSVNGGAVFSPGIYIFCQGLSIAGNGTVTGTGVHFYFAGGTLAMSGNPTIALSAPTSGTYHNILMWLPRTNPATTLDMLGGGTFSTYAGIVYAPAAQVHVTGNAGTSIGAIIAQTVYFSGTGDISLGPAPPLAVSTATLPNATAGVSYSTNLVAANGTPAYSWAGTGLPGWLTLSTGGTLSGTPPAAGAYTFNTTVTDSATPAGTATRSLTLNVNAPALAISGPTALPNWTRNRPYPSTTMTAANGTPGYTWSATGLPNGLAISAAGVITGTPTTSNTYNPVIRVVDSTGNTVTRAYTIVISTGPTVSTTALPAWTVNRPYSATAAATGGAAPYTWSATNVPAGLAISAAGVISGTPTAPGTSQVSLTATDATGATGTQNNIVLVINAAPAISGPVLPHGAVGLPYTSGAVTLTGGTAPYSYSATGLPAGLAIASGTGAITGTPTAAGAATVVITLTDAAGATATRTQAVYILEVVAPANLPVSQPKGSAYASGSFTINGGAEPYTCSVNVSGPGNPGQFLGCTVSGSTVALSGALPTSGGGARDYAVVLTVTGVGGATASYSYNLTAT